MGNPGLYPSLVRFRRKVRGGAQAILADADDGRAYVVKFANNVQGPHVLFNEAVGTELYRAFGLLVPNWSPVWVSESFLNKNPASWMDDEAGPLRPSPGLAFGSCFLGDREQGVLEILPASYFCKIRNLHHFWAAWLIDLCTDHKDCRQALFLRGGQLFTAVFIDHGHMFGGPKPVPSFQASASNLRLRGPQYLDTRVYSFVPSRALTDFARIAATIKFPLPRDLAKRVPKEWQAPKAFQKVELCLDKLKDPVILSQLARSVENLSVEQKTNGRTQPTNAEKPHGKAVLCARV